ncbi:hypothetical protein CC1G_14225 [Coprinopsis cinerea okayama7|uniref:Uncharacterized protein n=1 Tax=Coprinopsis cinerea (strain Okayama-7 / 130 / ATCC MYA-4618 / FGSC 9003) TaxID=240176 RepID=D6RL90_COPC7|nr:hypothetical protein CC1G_14225 [Coprinopsis cinerea okayama7\|eukprot:XP_002911692.1 hypothetical protein CC1G_14225 [Coprinopsis cinerea okayama7\
MSYASVAAQNVPPQEKWPQPDPALLNTTPPTDHTVVDDAAKVNVVGPDFKENPHTAFEENIRRNVSTSESEGDDDRGDGSKRRKHRRHRKHHPQTLWDQATEYLLRPGVAGGLVGIANVGLLTGVGYTFYSKPLLRRDPAAISTAAVSTLALLFAEGYLAEQYSETPEGQRQVRRAKDKTSALARYVDDLIHRTTTLNVLVGTLNTAVVGGIGYVAYANWDRPWNRSTVSTVAAGALALLGFDGYLLEQYRE